MYKNGDFCPVCGSGHLHRTVKDKAFKYKGESIIVNDFVVYSCDDCEESLVPKSSMRSSEKTIRDFQRGVDGLLTSEEIKKIREALGFTQEMFANVLGVGLKTFARYENGTVTQNRTTDHLLRILFEKPDALKIISKDAARGIPLKKVVDIGGATFYNPHYGVDKEIKYKVNF
jgi:HTH-type transcriptional regulator/antitoxin MqsA